jgi:hypothetical protein
MHNDEGKLFDAVFHKLLGLGVAIVALAAVVWFVWAIARTSAITHEASQPEAPAEAGSSMRQAPAEPAALGSTRATVPGKVAPADTMIELFIRPVVSLAARVCGHLDRLPPALSRTAGDAAFFIGGPS